jgi:hypothetical protein
MYSYLVEYEGKIIGTYKKVYDAESFILSCLQNNFMKNFALIHTYRGNSCFRQSTKKVDLETYTELCNFNDETTYSNSLSESTTDTLSYESSSNSMSSTDTDVSAKLKKNTPVKVVCEPVNKSVNIDYSNPIVLEMAKQKIDLQHKINMMKKQKEKIEESKNIYENDLKLFNMFRASKDSNPTFEIPELFTKKYEIMFELYLKNELSWENFVKKYQHENFYGDYFASNSYEDMFINSTKSSENSESSDDINEEFIINTESD